MTDSLHTDLRGGDTGWVWAFQFGINFDCRSEDFRDIKSFRKWAFDPEFGIVKQQRVLVNKEWVDFPLFWPHAALKVFGLDIAIGFCVRKPIIHLLKTS